MSIMYQEKGILEVETTGSAIEAAAGLAVIVLAIIGLAHRDGGLLAPIAVIILGIALLAQGGAVAAESARMLTAMSGGTVGTADLGGGMTAEMLAGVAVVILGILGVVGLSAPILVAAAIITAGAGLVVATASARRINALKLVAPGVPATAIGAGQATMAGTMGAQMLASGAAIVLGILALCITAAMPVLIMVGLLVLGASVAISGGTVAGRTSFQLFGREGATR